MDAERVASDEEVVNLVCIQEPRVHWVRVPKPRCGRSRSLKSLVSIIGAFLECGRELICRMAQFATSEKAVAN